MVKFVAVGTNKQKGNSLEQFFGKILSSLGYINLQFNVSRTGKEVDIQGTNRLITHSVRCECKAHQDQIGSNSIKKFFTDVHQEVSHNTKIKGIFISISGFKGTALAYYDQFSTEDKEYFKLMDENDLFSELQSAALICSEEELKLIISYKTKIPYKESTIILSERGIFWEVTLEDEVSGEKYLILLDNEGKEIKRSDSDYLLSIDEFATKNYVSLVIKEKLLTILLNIDEISVNDLISEIDEPPQEIKSSIANLIAENIVEIDSDKITLKNEIDSFLVLAKYFNNKEQINTFILSKYYYKNLKSILRYVESKYFVKFEDDEKKAIYNILLVSPKALLRCLFGDSSSHKNSLEHLDELNLDAGEREKKLKEIKTGFMEDFFYDLIGDVISPKNRNLMMKNEIVLAHIKAEIKLAKRNELFVKSWLNPTLAFVRVDGPIKAGQFVSPTNPEAIFNSADAFLAMEEFNLAIKDYNLIIELWNDDEKAVTIATHNKGLAYFHKGDYKKALEEFKKVQFKEVVRPNVLINICSCYHNLKFKKPLDNTLIILSKKWPKEALNLKKQLNLIS